MDRATVKVRNANKPSSSSDESSSSSSSSSSETSDDEYDRISISQQGHKLQVETGEEYEHEDGSVVDVKIPLVHSINVTGSA